MLVRLCAPPIYRGHFSSNNSRKTPIARPLGRYRGLFREFEVSPKFQLRSRWWWWWGGGGGGGGGHFDEKIPPPQKKKNHFFKGCGETMAITQLIIGQTPCNYFQSKILDKSSQNATLSWKKCNRGQNSRLFSFFFVFFGLKGYIINF